MKKLSALSQKKRYSWSATHTIYRGSLWNDFRASPTNVGRDYVNAGYWVHIVGFRLARSEVMDVPAEV